MSKQKNYTFIIFILIFAFFIGAFSFPKYFNQGVDFLNEKSNLDFPYFWNVPFKLGLDLQGGTHLIYEADLSSIEADDYNSSMQGLRDVIERRVNYFGVREPIIQTQQKGDSYRLIVELAGAMDPGEAIKEIGKTPFLEFKEKKENYEDPD